MITSDVIHRVFRIRYKNSEATGFTLEIEGREYLVTAKHVVGGPCDGESLDVFANGSWRSCAARCVGHAEGDRDISVLALQECLTPPGLSMPATSKGVIYGQDVYFLGFPYGFVGHYILGDNGWPLPFVKKATVSLFDQETFLLDGHNNPGFSGGPVVFTRPARNEYSVLAVISGFRAVNEPVYAGTNPVYAGDGKPVMFRYNTDIIVAWSVDFAVRLIEANPVGANRRLTGACSRRRPVRS